VSNRLGQTVRVDVSTFMFGAWKMVRIFADQTSRASTVHELVVHARGGWRWVPRTGRKSAVRNLMHMLGPWHKLLAGAWKIFVVRRTTQSG
jgi:hypothetical protein